MPHRNTASYLPLLSLHICATKSCDLVVLSPRTHRTLINHHASPLICNLLELPSHPPWTSSFDQEVYTTLDREGRVPFHRYILGWKRLLAVLHDISSVDAHSIDRSEALDCKTTEVQQQLKDARAAWTTGDEVTQREIERSWLEQLACDPAWETRGGWRVEYSLA